MKFDTVQELIDYLTEAVDLKKVEVSFTPIKTENISEGTVLVESLSDSPSVLVEFDESLEENILVVESYESVPLACSTGKVNLLGRTIYASVCETVENSPVIHLNISHNEQKYSNTPFKLVTTSDSDYIMRINPNTLNE